MKVCTNRIGQDIEIISRFSSNPGPGCTRLSYSTEDRNARNYLIQQMEDLDLKISVDGIGNIRARREGRVPNLPPVLVGSHIDTVINGGNFDGVLGVVAGLEIMRLLAWHQVDHYHPVELIIFAEEEGASFGYPLAGSKAMIGELTVDEMKELTNSQGESLYLVAKEFGLNPDSLPETMVRPGDIKGMLEIHIEQSVVLENEGIPVGIVDKVFGGRWLGVTIEGVANHAGATPMRFRHDPMLGAAEIIAQIPQLAAKHGTSSTVATVGQIKCQPNAANVIPGEVFFTVDIRDVGTEVMDSVNQAVTEFVHQIVQARRLSAQVTTLGDTKPVGLSPKVVELLTAAAGGRGIKYKLMNSGALHDACILSQVTEVGMIFIPSIGGRSHAPQELSRYQDIGKGCDVLLDTVLALAK